MTDTIKITNLGQLTYPPPGTSCREESEALARMDDSEKEKIAMQLQVPSGTIAFKLPMPGGVDSRSKYFGHVRYVQAYDPMVDEFIGRMDLGYGEEAID